MYGIFMGAVRLTFAKNVPRRPFSQIMFCIVGYLERVYFNILFDIFLCSREKDGVLGMFCEKA